jgi:hypothetical protein
MRRTVAVEAQGDKARDGETPGETPTVSWPRTGAGASIARSVREGTRPGMAGFFALSARE